MSNKYEAVLYDLDGTLTDSVPIIIKSFHMCYMEVLGEVPRSDENLTSYIGKPLMEIFTDYHDEKTSKALFDAYLRVNEAMLANDELNMFDGVMDSLLRLHERGVRQGIVTSKRFDSAMVTIKLKGLDKIFEQITVLENTTKHKPDPEPLIYSASKMGITDMKKIVYVGDAVVDYECALNAGTDFALVDWTKMNRDDFKRLGTPRIITSLDDIL